MSESTGKFNLDWKPMIKVPEVISAAAFISDEDILDEFNGRADKDYIGNKNLKVLNYSLGVVMGSNPFAVALIGNIARKYGFDVATPEQIELILQTDSLPLRGTYEDSALALMSEGEPNGYLARDLAKQVKARGFKIRHPIVIPLAGVDVVNDSSSPYGLSFALRENAQLIEASHLSMKNNGERFIETENGLPSKFDENGERTFYTFDSGLLRWGLEWDFNVCSYEDFVYSRVSGRVVLVRGGARAENPS